MDSNQQPAGIKLAPSIQGDELAARRRGRPIIERSAPAPVVPIKRSSAKEQTA